MGTADYEAQWRTAVASKDTWTMEDRVKAQLQYEWELYEKKLKKEKEDQSGSS